MFRRSCVSILISSFLCLLLAGCKDDNAMSAAASPELIGTWTATSLTYTPVGGGTAIDVVAEGLGVTAVFRADLTYTFTFVDPGPPVVTEVENGTYSVTGSVVTVVPDNAPGDPSDLEIVSLTSASATLYQAIDEFDFDDDGTESPATTTAVLVRQ